MFKKENIPWNKGKKEIRPNVIKKLSDSHKGIIPSKITRKRLSKVLKGKNTWSKGRKLSPEHIQRIIENCRRGEKSNFWKGGKKHSHGYILIHKPNHLFAQKDGYVYEHRLVAEKYLGRYLTRKEIIHHINGITNDNRPENLYLFTTSFNHKSYHRSLLRKNNPIKLITKSNLPNLRLSSCGN